MQSSLATSTKKRHCSPQAIKKAAKNNMFLNQRSTWPRIVPVDLRIFTALGVCPISTFSKREPATPTFLLKVASSSFSEAKRPYPVQPHSVTPFFGPCLRVPQTFFVHFNLRSSPTEWYTAWQNTTQSSSIDGGLHFSKRVLSVCTNNFAFLFLLDLPFRPCIPCWLLVRPLPSLHHTARAHPWRPLKHWYCPLR